MEEGAATTGSPALLLAHSKVIGIRRNPQVYHYRDNTGLEVDAIVDIAPGRWAAFEVKLGVGWVDEAARALLKFASRVDTDRCGEPAALGVIVGSDYGYQRPDGVSVIPLGALGP